MRDKVQEVLELVKATDSINKSNVAEIVRMQDIVNVNGLQAREIMQQLDSGERNKLLWIVATVANYETLRYWITFGLIDPWTAEADRVLHEHYEERYREKWEEIRSKERALQEKERELNKRECELRQREESAEVRAEKQAGEKVWTMRQQIKQLQVALGEEQALNRKAKRLTRLVANLYT